MSWEHPLCFFLTGHPGGNTSSIMADRGEGLKYNKQHLGCVWRAAIGIETNGFLIAFRDWYESKEAGLALSLGVG